MNTQTESTGILRKPKREGVVKIKAESIKPPEFEELSPGNFAYRLVVVSNGKELRLPCTKEVYRRADGPPVPVGTDKMGRGLDFRTESTFYIIKSPARDGLVTAIDIQPENKTARGMVSEEAKKITSIVIRISPTGDQEIKQIPPGVDDKELLLIMNELDTKDQVAVNEILGHKYEVSEVAGSTIKLVKIGSAE